MYNSAALPHIVMAGMHLGVLTAQGDWRSVAVSNLGVAKNYGPIKYEALDASIFMDHYCRPQERCQIRSSKFALNDWPSQDDGGDSPFPMGRTTVQPRFIKRDGNGLRFMEGESPRSKLERTNCLRNRLSSTNDAAYPCIAVAVAP